MEASAATAALSLSGAAVGGIICQSVARSLRFPGIVLLLAVGVLLGPDVAGIIQPKMLGAAMPEVVGFSVAVILFEGGMHLDVSRFRKQHKAIRRLVTYGAVTTALGGTLAAKFIMGWDWRLSALFGCLVIVTGPTVVTPLVRRFRLRPAVADILEAEGVLIDAVGAVIAVVALEVALEPSAENVKRAALGIAARLGFGALAGLVGGVVLGGLLRYRNIIANGLENVFTLALVWGLFKGCETILHESGIAAVTVAGLVVGNLNTRIHDQLLEFKEQLTVLLIGVLFVLLAADVRLADVESLGWPAVWTVAALIVFVRPANVLLSTINCQMALKQRLFIAWIGPRGIVAAAVATLVATALDNAGFAGGQRLKAIVFLVIAVTVVLAALTGGPIAKLLGLSQRAQGWLLLGANPLAVTLAQLLEKLGEEVTLVDRSAEHCHHAASLGISVIHDNGLDDDTLRTANISARAGVAAVTTNNEINFLFIKKAAELANVPRRFAALKRGAYGASAKLVHNDGGHVLFGDEYNVERWMGWLEDEEADIKEMTAGSETTLGHEVKGATLAIPLVHRRGSSVRPVADDLALRNGDVVHFAIRSPRRDEAMIWLHSQGWRSD